MLTKVEIRNGSGDLLTLPLDDVSNGYSVQNIEGLGPVKATVVSSSFAGLDGSQYHSSRRENRNIVLKLGIEPDYVTTTARTLRQYLYTFFMTKAEVKMTFFMDDGLEVDITGRVESCEPGLFTQEPTVDVSVICFDPDFVDPDQVTVTSATVSDGTQTLIEYDGSVESGFLLQLLVDRVISDFTVFVTSPDSTITMIEFSADLESDDIVNISTVSGDKYMTLLRDFTESSILYARSRQSGWPDLKPGDNYIRVFASGDPIDYNVKFFKRYGGL